MRNLRGRWFEDVGLPLDEPTSALAHRLAPHVERVLDWDAAVRLIQDPRTLQAWEEERAVRAAERATRRAGLDDPYLVRVVAGAASQAAFDDALARATDADDHPFVQKYRLFERGRWVLGKIARTLYIF